MELFFFWLAFGTVTAACFLAGLARARFTPAPIIATAVILGSYVALVASVWIWASRCWECGDAEFGRRPAVAVTTFAVGLMAMFDVFAIWLAAWISTLIWEQPSMNTGRLTRVSLWLAAGAVLLAGFLAFS